MHAAPPPGPALGAQGPVGAPALHLPYQADYQLRREGLGCTWSERAGAAEGSWGLGR